MISSDSLLRLFVVLEMMGVEMINSFAVLDPLIKTFIQVVIIIGPLTIAGMVWLLKRIEKENPDRIRWK